MKDNNTYEFVFVVDKLVTLIKDGSKVEIPYTKLEHIENGIVIDGVTYLKE